MRARQCLQMPRMGEYGGKLCWGQPRIGRLLAGPVGQFGKNGRMAGKRQRAAGNRQRCVWCLRHRDENNQSRVFGKMQVTVLL